MGDYAIRATALDGKIRAFAVDTTETLEELRARHGTSATASAALGRTLSAGAMMGIMLKGGERLTIQVKGDGPLGQIVVDANAKGEIRGYVDNPKADLPTRPTDHKLDVGGLVGHEGFIYVTKDLGLKEPYRGSTPIVSGEIGEDFTYYFAKSEQTPSAVALGVLIDRDLSVRTSGGFILQLMPGMTEEEIAELEQHLAGLPTLSALMDEGLDMEQILKRVVADTRVTERVDVRFQCKCSRERVEDTLISIGRDEVESMLREDGQAEVVCHFCNEAYRFDGKDLERLLACMADGSNEQGENGRSDS